MGKVSNVNMHIKQMIKVTSTLTVFIVRNLEIKPLTPKQQVILKNTS